MKRSVSSTDVANSPEGSSSSSVKRAKKNPFTGLSADRCDTFGNAGIATRLEVDDVHRLECDDSGTCLLTPCNDVKVRSLEVRATVTNDEGQTTALSPVPFRIRRIPDPELKWVGHTAEDQFIWRASMLSFASVAVTMSNFDFDVDMQVVTFWLGVERGGEFRYFRSDNFFLTEEMKQALVLTQPGDRIWIGNAYVSMPDGTERELAPLLLTLKD